MKKTRKTKTDVILDEQRLVEVRDYFLTQPAFAFDFEGAGEHRGVCHLAELTWLSMATNNSVVVIPFGHPIGTKILGSHKERRTYGGTGPRAGTQYNATVWDYEEPPNQIPRETVFEILRPLFFSESIVKSAHGAIYDISSSAKYFGEVMPGPYNDTVIQSWILDENRHRHGLKFITKDFYGYSYDNEDVGKRVETYPFGLVAHYSYCDALYAWLFYKRFTPRIEAEGLTGVYELEMDVLNTLVGMRLAGSHVDVDRLKELEVELSERRTRERTELFGLAGYELNPNSPAQKQELLFGKKRDGFQGLKPWKMTDSARKKYGKKNGPTPPGPGEDGYLKLWSTDDEALESFPLNDVACKLREYQETNKLLGTYVLSYLGTDTKPTQIYNERIHAEFVQYGTTTRRFSCRTPNLQNIPRPDTELGKLIRGVWDTDPGWKLIVGDYGQIELVVFAHFAGRGHLYDAFLEGDDPHQMTADLVGIERQMAKTLNFSMSYGAGMRKVSSMIGVDEVTGRSILDDHKRSFPEIYALKEEIYEAARSRIPPYVRTLLGGKRRLPEINAKDTGVRARAERQAVSSVIQGSAADLIKLAMVRCDRLLGEQLEETHMTLSVHDEIVLTAPEHEAEAAAEILREAMLGKEIQRLIRVPLTADIKVVDRWSEAK